MLEEKLRQASQANTTHRKRLFVMLGLAAIITISSILLMTYLSNNNGNENTATATLSASKTPLPNMPSSAQQSTEQLAKQSDKQTNEQWREQFKTRLGLYEAETAPALLDANLSAWNAQQDLAIKSLKDHATAAFAVSDYTNAMQQLSQLEHTAKQVLEQHAVLFSAEFRMAKEALQADHYKQAKLHIDKALQLKPGDPATLQLAQQIDALPKIIALLNKAAVARTENNLDKEYAAISAAFKLAPQRLELQQRQVELAKRIKENKFTPLIARGLEHVANRQLRAARSDYQQAKALDPKRSELRVLQQSIHKLALNQDLNSAIARGKTAIRQDNWRKARSIYAAASQRHPDDQNIRDGLLLSNKLVSLHETLDVYLKQPERLSAKNIASSAQQTLLETRVFSANSPSLTQKANSLKKLIAAVNINIPVTVTSDNQTYIVVKGIGKVGLTLARTIQLKAGFYSFEGIRKGYKSKLLNVRIPIGSKSFAIEVICDERI
ncbi:MAG: hypothetical protein Q9M16_02940 [Mariprofundus sp.]|nr:hypothetical protein [Mariprofundus sp.]